MELLLRETFDMLLPNGTHSYEDADTYYMCTTMLSSVTKLISSTELDQSTAEGHYLLPNFERYISKTFT